MVVGVDVAKDWHYVQPIDAASGRSLDRAFGGFDLLDQDLLALAKARKAGRSNQTPHGTTLNEDTDDINARHTRAWTMERGRTALSALRGYVRW